MIGVELLTEDPYRYSLSIDRSAEPNRAFGCAHRRLPRTGLFIRMRLAQRFYQPHCGRLREESPFPIHLKNACASSSQPAKPPETSTLPA
jgi:hypothetical protein